MGSEGRSTNGGKDLTRAPSRTFGSPKVSVIIPCYNGEKFWKEIKQKYKTKEVISSAKQTWAGIGIIFT